MKKVEMNKKMKEEIRKAQKSAKEEAGEFKKFISKVMLLTWLSVLLLVDLLERLLLA